MKINLETDGSYSGVMYIGTALKSRCKGCATMAEAINELFKDFI